jgi:hypothetical protein
VSRLEAKGVSFCVLSMSGTQFLDTVTGTRRRLMLAMLGAVGQAKREAMLEPQREGIASKPLQGVARQSKLDTVLPHLGMLPSGSSIASPGCSRRHVSLSIDYTGSAAPHGVTQTGFPVRSTSLLSRPDLAPPKSRRAAEGIGRSGATRSHAQRAVAREHGEDGEHRTFPEVSTVAHSRRSRIGRLRIHCEA